MDREGLQTLTKIAGACLVIISCSGLGIFASGQFSQRLKNLEQLRQMIFLLKGEIVYGRSPLTDAFERVGARGRGEIAEAFKRTGQRLSDQPGEPFFIIWQEEIDRIPEKFPLLEEDRQKLKDMGEHLGYLDTEQQERTILLYLEQLDLSIEYLRSHRQERVRLYTSLGIMGGLFLTIVLV